VNDTEEVPMIESYYKLPIDIDTYVQELLEELPQFTWKVDGEFIGKRRKKKYLIKIIKITFFFFFIQIYI